MAFMDLNFETTPKTPSYEVNWNSMPDVISNSYSLSGGYGAPVAAPVAAPTKTLSSYQPVGATKSLAPSPGWGGGGSGASYSTPDTGSTGVWPPPQIMEEKFGFNGPNTESYRTTTYNNSGSAYRNALLKNYANMMIQAQNKANAANEKRYQEGMAGWQSVADMYKPGGSFGQGANAMYERGKTKNLAQAGQNLISSGLGGTTISAGLPGKYEEEVGTPFKLQLQDLMTSKYAEALGNKLGFLERKTEKGPEFGQIAQILASMG